MVNSDTVHESSGRDGYFHERDEFGFLYVSVPTLMNNHDKILEISKNNFKKFIKKILKKFSN